MKDNIKTAGVLCLYNGPMRELNRFTFTWLTVALAAQLLTYTRTWNLFNTGAVILLALALSFPLVPIIKRNEILKAFLVLIVTALSVYGLMLKGHNSPAETINLLLTAILWRALFEDEWPHWKRRLTWLTNTITNSLSHPVMPLPHAGS